MGWITLQRLEDQAAKGLPATHNLGGLDLSKSNETRSSTEARTFDFLLDHQNALGLTRISFPEREDRAGANEHSVTFNDTLTIWVRDIDIYSTTSKGEAVSFQFQCKGLARNYTRLKRSLQGKVCDSVAFSLYTDVRKDLLDLVLRECTNTFFCKLLPDHRPLLYVSFISAREWHNREILLPGVECWDLLCHESERFQKH
jgi:hypothetical protein